MKQLINKQNGQIKLKIQHVLEDLFYVNTLNAVIVLIREVKGDAGDV